MPVTFAVEQDLRIFDATPMRGGIRVDVYGGRPATCGTVELHFDDAVAAAEELARLQDWGRDGRAITLVECDDVVALVDEHALFAAAYDPRPPG